MQTPTPSITKLETLLARKRQLCSIGVSLDAYMRWGNGSDPDFAAFAMKELEERPQTTKSLETLIDNIQRSSPETLVAWAEAHIALLEDYLEERVAGDSTAAFVAKRELQQWREVARGELRYADENPVHVKPDPELYERLFGVPAPELYY